MGDRVDLTSATVDSVSLERALKDAEAANLRVIELSKKFLDSEARVAKLEAELAALRRTLDPRRKVEDLFRRNHTAYAIARRAKRMIGR